MTLIFLAGKPAPWCVQDENRKIIAYCTSENVALLLIAALSRGRAA